MGWTASGTGWAKDSSHNNHIRPAVNDCHSCIKARCHADHARGQSVSATGYPVIVGAIIGALARLGTAMKLLEIVRSSVGSWITAQFGYHTGNGGFQILPFVVGVIVAAVLIGICVAIMGRSDTTVHR